jgi:hypothetical protein
MKLVGTRELGLEVQWKLDFVGFGERAATTHGVIFLDVGGTLAPGVLDHHALEGRSCAAELVFHRPELVYGHLVEPWLRRAESGRLVRRRWRPSIVTHGDPDWDSVVAVHLVQRLVEDGAFPPEAGALVAYARVVDQGLFRLDLEKQPSLLFAAHTAYLAVQNLRDLGSAGKMRLGLQLVKALVDGVRVRGKRAESIEDLVPDAPGTTAWTADPAFARLVRFLEDDVARGESDLRAGRATRALLPASDGGPPIDVSAFVSPLPPTSILHKYWVRASGHPLFVCPDGEERTRNGRRNFPRVIVSLDPNHRPQGRAPSLRGLGFALEVEETRRRREDGEVGVQTRTGPPRFDGGYCDNADPWYDGRAHDWTIVDSPRATTVLPFDDVVETVTRGRFWRIPLERGEVTLVSVLPEGSCAERDRAFAKGRPLAPFAGMSGTLDDLYADAREWDDPSSGVSGAPPAGIRTATSYRALPSQGVTFRITTVTCDAGVMLEDLVDACRPWFDPSPDYRFIQVAPARHFSGPGHLRELLIALGGGDVGDPEVTSQGDVHVLLEGRSVVVVEKAAAMATPPRAGAGVEILLYTAFLWEALVAFSRGIGELFPRGRDRLSGVPTALRAEFVRFQARYYQLDVSRAASGRRLFARLSEELCLPALYEEVGSELDHLAELEQHLAEKRRASADLWIEFMLIVLAVAGAFQAVQGFVSWGWPKTRENLWWVVVGIAAPALVFCWKRVLPARKLRQGWRGTRPGRRAGPRDG